MFDGWGVSTPWGLANTPMANTPRLCRETRDRAMGKEGKGTENALLNSKKKGSREVLLLVSTSHR